MTDVIAPKRRQSETTGDNEIKPEFAPSAAQIRYLLALEEAFATGQVVSDRGICKAMKQELWPLIVRRHEWLAYRGSVKSLAILAKLRTIGQRGGGFTPAAEGEDLGPLSIRIPRFGA